MDSSQRNGVTPDAIVAAFAERLDALVASWGLAIRVDAASVKPTHAAVPRDATAILADLEREMSELQRHCAEHRSAADVEQREANDWEKRAMLSIQEGRDDLARQALTRRQERLSAWEMADGEAAALETLREAFAHAISAMRATLPA